MPTLRIDALDSGRIALVGLVVGLLCLLAADLNLKAGALTCPTAVTAVDDIRDMYVNDIRFVEQF